MPTTPVAKPGPFDGLTPAQLAAVAQSYGYDVDTSNMVNTPAGPSPADQKVLDSLKANEDTARGNAAQANRFQSYNDETTTGPAFNHKEGLARTLGTMGVFKGSQNYGVMDKINLALGTADRPNAFPLRSQGEVQWLKDTAPSVGDSRQQNAQFQKYFGDQMVQNVARRAFYNSWLKTKGSLEGADDAWNNWGSQHFDVRGSYVRPNRDQQAQALKQKSAQTRGGPVLLGQE